MIGAPNSAFVRIGNDANAMGSDAPPMDGSTPQNKSIIPSMKADNRWAIQRWWDHTFGTDHQKANEAAKAAGKPQPYVFGIDPLNILCYRLLRPAAQGVSSSLNSAYSFIRHPIQTLKDIRTNVAKLTAELIDNPRGILEDIITRWDRFSKLTDSEKNDFIVKNGSQLITDMLLLKGASKAAQAGKAQVLAKLSPKARELFNTLSKQKELDKVAKELLKAEGEALAPKTGAEAAELKPYGGPGGGHHVPAKKAFEGAPGYDSKAALAIPNAEMTRLGVQHLKLVTPAQQRLYSLFAKTGNKLTWNAMQSIETEALVAGGMEAGMARATVQKAIQALKDAGVSEPTRIPWGAR